MRCFIITLMLIVTTVICTVLGLVSLIACNPNTNVSILSADDEISYLANGKHIVMSFNDTIIDDIARAQNKTSILVCYHYIWPRRISVINEPIGLLHIHTIIAVFIIAGILLVVLICVGMYSCCERQPNRISDLNPVAITIYNVPTSFLIDVPSENEEVQRAQDIQSIKQKETMNLEVIIETKEGNALSLGVGVGEQDGNSVAVVINPS